MDVNHQILSKLPISHRIGQELHKVYHRESRGQEIRDFHRKRPGSDMDHPLMETRGGDQGVKSLDIGILVDRRSGKSTLKTLTQIWAIHHREDTCHVIVHSGDVGTSQRDIGTQEIGVPEVMKVGTLEVSKRRGEI
jgi:hypothetical protein